MLCVRRWSAAGPAGRLRCWLVHCRELKTGQEKVQLYYEDDPLCPSSYIIYPCTTHTQRAVTPSSVARTGVTKTLTHQTYLNYLKIVHLVVKFITF